MATYRVNPDDPRVSVTTPRLPGTASRPTAAEIAWAAGIIEGEGYFYGKTSPGRDKRGQAGHWFEHRLRVEVAMTDLDILERLQRVFGLGTMSGPRWMKDSTKPVWRWSVATKGHVDEVVSLIYPWLGVRRQFQCREAYLRCGRRLPFEVGNA